MSGIVTYDQLRRVAQLTQRTVGLFAPQVSLTRGVRLRLNPIFFSFLIHLLHYSYIVLFLSGPWGDGLVAWPHL